MDLVNQLEGRLLIAVPKKGRLLQAALNLLEGADIKFRRENRLDIALVTNLHIALVFLPAADIPTFVGEGRVDLGITGRDTVAEHAAVVQHEKRVRVASGNATPVEGEVEIGCEELMDLGFGSCQLQVQVPKNGPYRTSADLVGKNIGTSFVHLAEDFFAKLERDADGSSAVNGNGVGGNKPLRTKIIELSGSVEAACALGVADGIVDLVESGETMRAAGLIALETVVDSTAVLVKSKHASNPELLKLVTARIAGVITAQKYVLCQYNVHRDRLHDATLITPGKRAPTINALEEDGWVAVSSMVKKKEISTVMDNLSAIGAQDIIVLSIANTRAG